jgi:hypothetical protein
MPQNDQTWNIWKAWHLKKIFKNIGQTSQLEYKNGYSQGCYDRHDGVLIDSFTEPYTSRKMSHGLELSFIISQDWK